MQSITKIVALIVVAFSLASCGSQMPKMVSCGNGVFVEEGKTCSTQPVTPPAVTPPVTPPVPTGDPEVTDQVINALTATTKFRVCGSEVRLRKPTGEVVYFVGAANGMKILIAARTGNNPAVIQGKINGEFFEFTTIPQLASANWAGVNTELSQDGVQGTYLTPGCTK